VCLNIYFITMTKAVKQKLYAHPYNMGGFPIRQPFPTNQVDHIGPFILLHHAKIDVPKDFNPKNSGVGPHPHRGFAPVTFIFEGGVHHRDSRGNNSIVEKGGVQWMNAGMGVIHSERPPENIHELGGVQEIIQLWVNIPKAHKKDQPEYIPLKAEDIPSISYDDGKVIANIVAGELNGVKGAINGLSPLTAATIVMNAGGKLRIEVPTNFDAVLYILSGMLQIKAYGLAEHHHAYVFERDGEHVEIEAKEDTRILYLAGEEINEKMVAQGPFVMNSETEIMEAYRDYQMGKMGILIEE
jgi:redox-sensitive bicupin YhaK (pirin superfamily)